MFEYFADRDDVLALGPRLNHRLPGVLDAACLLLGGRVCRLGLVKPPLRASVIELDGLGP